MDEDSGKPHFSLRERELAMAALEEAVRTPELKTLDALLDRLTATALTESEWRFSADLRLRAKQRVAEARTDSEAAAIVRELLNEHLGWIRLRLQTPATSVE